jgi:hypothetical protein
VECPTLEEVREAVGDLKHHKAPAADEIPAELLKDGGNQVISAISNLMTLIWQLEQIPDEGKKSGICLIHEKEDKLSCETDRGTALLCAACKVLTNIICLKPELFAAENIIGKYQASIRTGRSTIVQLFTVKQMLKKCWENSTKVYQYTWISEKRITALVLTSCIR